MILEDFLITSLCINISACYNDNPKLSLYKSYNDVGIDAIQNETFKVITVSYPPLSEVTNEGRGRGIAFDIFDIIQKRYKFNYQIVHSQEESLLPLDEIWDKYENISDLTVAIFPVNGKIKESMKFSITIGRTKWHILMKRPELSATGSGLLQPFTWDVWIYVVVAVLIVGLILYILAKVQSKFQEEIDWGEFSLSSCLWFVYGAILKQGSTINPSTDSTRIIFATWWIFIMILTSFYTANLTAFLTLNTFTLPINTITDIGKKGYTWITLSNNVIDKITSEPDTEISKGLVGSKKLIIDSENIEDCILKYNYLFIAEKTLIEYWMYDNFLKKINTGNTSSSGCPFAVTEWSLLSTSIAFVYSKKFKFDFILDKALQRLLETGVVPYLFKYKLPRTNICPLNPKVQERRLQNADLKLTYYIVAAGFSLATVFFIFEIIKKICCKRNKNTRSFPRNKLFVVSPPPPYNTLFGPPFANNPDYVVKREEINGRDYWCVSSRKMSTIQLIPVRAPSAVLFNYTKR